LVLFNRRQRKRLGFAFLYNHCAFGADTEAKARAVAQVFTGQPSLAIHYLDCALRAGKHACSAAGTFFFVDSYYFSSCHLFHRPFCTIIARIGGAKL
jgi:hypothetical protein